jgi:hypothetical protein
MKVVGNYVDDRFLTNTSTVKKLILSTKPCFIHNNKLNITPLYIKHHQKLNIYNKLENIKQHN